MLNLDSSLPPNYSNTIWVTPVFTSKAPTRQGTTPSSRIRHIQTFRATDSLNRGFSIRQLLSRATFRYLIKRPVTRNNNCVSSATNSTVISFRRCSRSLRFRPLTQKLDDHSFPRALKFKTQNYQGLMQEAAGPSDTKKVKQQSRAKQASWEAWKWRICSNQYRERPTTTAMV